MNDKKLFISICKKLLFEYAHSKELKNYIKHEASDYQILYTVFTNKFTKNKTNTIIEDKLLPQVLNVLTEGNINLTQLQYDELLKHAQALGIKPKIIDGKREYVIDFDKYPGLKKFLPSGYSHSDTITMHQNTQKHEVWITPDGMEKLKSWGIDPKESNYQDVVSKHPEFKNYVDKTDITNIPEKKYGVIDTISAHYNAMSTGDQITIGMAGLAAASLLIFASYKIYKRFFSKTSRQCKNLSFDKKTLCMAKYRLMAKEKELSNLKSGFTSECKKSKDEKKCKMEINKRIIKLMYKIKKQKAKIIGYEANVYKSDRYNSMKKKG